MNGAAARRFGRLAGATLVLGVGLFLGSCGHGSQPGIGDGHDRSSIYPANYRSDIISAMHAYLNDPTGIRDAAISPPARKTSGNVSLYAACVKFNPKKNASEYAGIREIAAVFLDGKFDQFVDPPRDLCAGASYAPFPELQKLPP